MIIPNFPILSMFRTRVYEDMQELGAAYKVVLLRNPTSLRLVMALCSILLGAGLAASTSAPSILTVMTAILPLKFWGPAFLLTGILKILFIGRRPQRWLEISVAVFSLFLWVLLNLSSVQSPKFDAFNMLLLITVVIETWVLVHTLIPHRQNFRRRAR